MGLLQKKGEKNLPGADGGLSQNPDLGDILDRNYNDAKGLFEKWYLEYQLIRYGGVISRTAEAIGIYPSNLHAKLRKYNIRT
jgi:two-component system nitrogen regulation response regulator NtrX